MSKKLVTKAEVEGAKILFSEIFDYERSRQSLLAIYSRCLNSNNLRLLNGYGSVMVPGLGGRYSGGLGIFTVNDVGVSAIDGTSYGKSEDGPIDFEYEPLAKLVYEAFQTKKMGTNEIGFSSDREKMCGIFLPHNYLKRDLEEYGEEIAGRSYLDMAFSIANAVRDRGGDVCPYYFIGDGIENIKAIREDELRYLVKYVNPKDLSKLGADDLPQRREVEFELPIIHRSKNAKVNEAICQLLKNDSLWLVYKEREERRLKEEVNSKIDVIRQFATTPDSITHAVDYVPHRHRNEWIDR